LFNIRIQERPLEPQERVNLAYIYHTDLGQSDKAIEILQKAIEDIPSFKVQGEELIAGIRTPGPQTIPVQ
jgi:tetratricopeptide (TPR) repeat protein